MIPLRICLENFMSYREEQELFFDNAPLWVLAGENGVGKSTIFDAITFALYGYTRVGSRNHQDLINHQADRLSVEFDFLINDLQYRIRRTVTRKGRTTREAFKISSSGNIQSIVDTDNETGLKSWVEHTIGLNQEAFTSCALLVQGQSDRLLTAKPTDRFKILKQIIDLSAYEKLHEKVDNLRKGFEGEFKALSEQLESMTVVSQEELNNAEENADRATKDFNNIQEQIETLNQVVQQAKQWEDLRQQIDKLQNQQQEYQKITQKSDEIQENFKRFQELSEVIPKIQSIFEKKEESTSAGTRIENLEAELKKLERDRDEVKIKQKDSEKALENLNQSCEILQKNLQKMNTKLLKISPLVNIWNNYIKEKFSRDECRKRLETFPNDLDQELEKIKAKEKELLELKAVFPKLQNTIDFRLILKDSLTNNQNAEEELKYLNEELNKLKENNKELRFDLDSTKKQEKEFATNLALIEAQYKETSDKLKNFKQAINQPTCELCGQEITPEHAQAETQKLQEKIDTQEFKREHFALQYQETQSRLDRLQLESDEIDDKILDIEKQIIQANTTKQQTDKTIETSLNQLEKAFDYLPSTYQIKISPTKPELAQEWIDITYPNETDMDILDREARTNKNIAKTLKQLEKKLADRTEFYTRYKIHCDRLIELETQFSLEEAQEARTQKEDLQKAKNQCEADIQKSQEKKELCEANKKLVNQEVQKISNRVYQNTIALEQNKSFCETREQDIQAEIEKLPEIWKKETKSINQNQLAQLNKDKQELSLSEEKFEKLKQATQSLTSIELEINRLEGTIQSLPPEAHCSHKEIEQQLKTLQTRRKQLDNLRKDADKKLNQLKREQEQYLQLEKNKKEAEHNQKIHKDLAILLGKDGLQSRILRDAERAIVEIANEILDSLSRGNMRLELRDEESSKKSKALDLIVYNNATGDRPTSVALTSGSQRFRIAVSLALAIGQYAGKGTRNIESVIIDEGFGSLDKNGRDDMIQELNHLQERLKRIILVSHQEEFFNAFSNGYRIELADDASRVSLLEPSL